MEGFKICNGYNGTGGKGFHITFANGKTVSVQFGYGNYCDNYSIEDDPKKARASSDAEVAVWGPSGEFEKRWGEDGDAVLGRQSPNEVLELMVKVASEK